MSLSIPKLPNHWRRIGTIRGAIEMFEHKLMFLRVGRSISTLKDGSEWPHISVSHNMEQPSWEILTKCKNEFIGEDVEAYQVLPAKKDYVNMAECLHVWAPLDGVRRVANLHDLTNERVVVQ